MFGKYKDAKPSFPLFVADIVTSPDPVGADLLTLKLPSRFETPFTIRLLSIDCIFTGCLTSTAVAFISIAVAPELFLIKSRFKCYHC